MIAAPPRPGRCFQIAVKEDKPAQVSGFDDKRFGHRPTDALGRLPAHRDNLIFGDALHMNVRRLIAVEAREEKPVRPGYTLDPRHSGPSPFQAAGSTGKMQTMNKSSIAFVDMDMHKGACINFERVPPPLSSAFGPPGANRNRSCHRLTPSPRCNVYDTIPRVRDQALPDSRRQ